MSTGWDNATLKKLKALTGKGLSTAEIGKRLGMSKNAVVGKLNRLGWNSKATSAASAKPAAKKQATVVAKKATTKPAAKSSVQKKVEKKSPAKATAKKPVKTTATKPVASKKTLTVKESKPKETPEKLDKKTLKTLAMHQRIIQHSLEMANMKPNQCRWPIGDPDSEHFHFCGAQVFTGKPYCYEHCKQAYQFTPLKKK